MKKKSVKMGILCYLLIIYSTTIFAQFEPKAYRIDKGVDKNKCSMSFIASTDRGTIFSMKTKPWYGEQGKLTPSRIAMLRGVEHKIFRLYSAEVKIEVDSESFDNEWYRDNY